MEKISRQKGNNLEIQHNPGTIYPSYFWSLLEWLMIATFWATLCHLKALIVVSAINPAGISSDTSDYTMGGVKE
jgi:hypothetical protein